MRYCPICNTHRFLKHLKYNIRYFWKHKIKGEPEPEINPIEIIASLMSAVIMVSMVGKMGKDIQDALEESKLKMEVK
jgi:hypothetical protein